MKTNNRFPLTAVFVAIILTFFACSGDDSPSEPSSGEPSSDSSGEVTFGYCDYGSITQWGGGCFKMEHGNDCDLEWGQVVEVCGDYPTPSSSSVTPNNSSSSSSIRSSSSFSSSSSMGGCTTPNSLGMGYNVLNSLYPNAKEVSSYPILNQDKMCQDGIVEFLKTTALEGFSQGTGNGVREFYQSMNTDLKIGGSRDIAIFFSVGLDMSFSVNQSTSAFQNYFYSQLRSHRYVQDDHIKSGYISVQNLSKYLSPALISDLQTKSPAQILDLYGTHVFIQYYKGGSLQANYLYTGTSLTTNTEITNAVQGSVSGFGAKAGAGVSETSIEKITDLNDNSTFSYTSCGGDALGTYTINEIGGRYSGWVKSIDNKPELCGIKDFNNSFIAIWDLVSAAGYSSKATELYDEFTRRADARGVFISSVSPKPCTPVDNSSTHYCSNGFLREYGRVTHNMQTYKTVVIGTQTWLAQNLTGNNSGYCYENSNSNCTTYGALYDWASAMNLSSSCNNSNCSIQSNHQGICPTGWHIPSSDEWNTLVGFVESNSKCSNCAGTKLKAKGGWDNNGNGTDDYGFSALPAGYRRASDGVYLVKGTSSSWWNADQYSSSADYIRMLSSSNSTEISSNIKVNGNPVRCIKN
jgi:uncharacterized protein (TIGR02145 family)